MWGRSEGLNRRFLRRFLKSQGGAAAVEFALVAGPFFFVLGTICETGLMLFTEYVLQNSVQEGSRAVRTGQVTTTLGGLKMTEGQFKAIVCGSVKVVVDCNTGVTVYVNSANNFAELETVVASPILVGPGGSAAFKPGGQLKSAAVIATYDWDFAFPFMDFLGNIAGGSKRRIHGMAVFRNEPF
ncbi:MAG: TadE/TadG family type IV pilus assembly protein [Hyphomicrobiales bacterium]